MRAPNRYVCSWLRERCMTKYFQILSAWDSIVSCHSNYIFEKIFEREKCCWSCVRVDGLPRSATLDTIRTTWFITFSLCIRIYGSRRIPNDTPCESFTYIFTVGIKEHLPTVTTRSDLHDCWVSGVYNIAIYCAVSMKFQCPLSSRTI